MKTKLALSALSALLLSIPWLVPHTGWVSLFALVPLLCMEHVAFQNGEKHFFLWHYLVFVLWNAATTFWVCNATVGGGIFAVLANALQMSVIFALFHASRKHLKGALPYILLAATWIAWERWDLTSMQISWPWLVLGNSFARTLSLCQWYEYTGALGGSLWIWCCNLGLFGLMAALSDGRFLGRWNVRQRVAYVFGYAAVLIVPAVTSAVIWNRYEEKSDGTLDVVIGQPDFDPYQKFQSLDRAQQNAIILDLWKSAAKDTSASLLFIAPETFTNDVLINEIESGSTWNRFHSFLQGYPNSSILFGASTVELYAQDERPSWTCRRMRDGLWYQGRNSALVTDAAGNTSVYHKSKLVVGTELTPYPAIFSRIDDLLGGVMGRCTGQKEASTLPACGTRIGSVICYESAYGEYCTGYVRKGAEALAVITNDAWWGDTPGYVQHCSWSSLRAIETRRDVARCANTGISCLVDQRGRILSRTPWWQKTVLTGRVNLNSRQTFFVRNGDIVGRVCVLVFALMMLALISQSITHRTKHSTTNNIKS